MSEGDVTEEEGRKVCLGGKKYREGKKERKRRERKKLPQEKKRKGKKERKILTNEKEYKGKGRDREREEGRKDEK